MRTHAPISGKGSYLGMRRITTSVGLMGTIRSRRSHLTVRCMVLILLLQTQASMTAMEMIFLGMVNLTEAMTMMDSLPTVQTREDVSDVLGGSEVGSCYILTIRTRLLKGVALIVLSLALKRGISTQNRLVTSQTRARSPLPSRLHALNRSLKLLELVGGPRVRLGTALRLTSIISTSTCPLALGLKRCRMRLRGASIPIRLGLPPRHRLRHLLRRPRRQHRRALLLHLARLPLPERRLLRLHQLQKSGIRTISILA